jgi:mRNA deadenylase 3'-5' endonuclease subunit Ccr4
MIAFKHARFAKFSHHVVDYDHEEIRPDGDCHARQGRTFRTRNIGLIVALKSIDGDKPGVVVGTTHLFWHPMCVPACIRFARGAEVVQIPLREGQVAVYTLHLV